MRKTFRIVPLLTEIANSARETAQIGRPDHAIVIANAPDAFPCRHCLEWAATGEAMVLFPFPAIPGDRPYAESGPIFVHRDACERYSATNRFPDAFREGRVVRGYNSRDEIVAAEIAAGDAERTIEEMLTNSEIAYLHVRSATRGCFTLKVERASESTSSPLER